MRIQGYLFLLAVCAVRPAAAQVDNAPFEWPAEVAPADSGKLFLGIHLLGFAKNNEYFHTTVEGYTLFGYQVNPYLAYHLSPAIRLDAGVYAQKDFGNNRYTTVEPTLALRMVHGPFTFTFGTLPGRLEHRLIEPLYEFERGLTARLEDGFEVRYARAGWFADSWVDWQHMIYYGDPNQERIWAGLSAEKELDLGNGLTLSIPLQGTVNHRGGQIDNNHPPVSTLLNGAVGIGLAKSLGRGQAGLKAYVAGYTDDSSSSSQYFKDGNGLYINPYFVSSDRLTVMGTYWHGTEYMSAFGGVVYPSANDLYPTRVDATRDLFMLRILYTARLADHLFMTARLEPFYDTYSSSIQYSYGLYFNFSDRYFLLNAAHH